MSALPWRVRPPILTQGRNGYDPLPVWTLVDANGRTVATFVHREDAEAVAAAMNGGKP